MYANLEPSLASAPPPALELSTGVLGDPLLRERALNIGLPVIAMVAVLICGRRR